MGERETESECEREREREKNVAGRVTAHLSEKHSRCRCSCTRFACHTHPSPRQSPTPRHSPHPEPKARSQLYSPCMQQRPILSPAAAYFPSCPLRSHPFSPPPPGTWSSSPTTILMPNTSLTNLHPPPNHHHHAPAAADAGYGVSLLRAHRGLIPRTHRRTRTVPWGHGGPLSGAGAGLGLPGAHRERWRSSFSRLTMLSISKISSTTCAATRRQRPRTRPMRLPHRPGPPYPAPARLTRPCEPRQAPPSRSPSPPRARPPSGAPRLIARGGEGGGVAQWPRGAA